MQWASLVIALVAIGLLVGERVRAKQRDSSYRALVDEAPASVLVIDAETVLYANKRVVSILGTDGMSTLVGRHFAEVFAPQTAQLLRENYARVIESGEYLSVKDCPIIGANASAVRCDLRMVPTTFGGGEGVQCVLNAVDDKHAALEALHETEERFKQFFAQMPVPMYRTRLDGTIVHANRALADMLGVAETDELVGVDAAGFYSDPDERDRLASMQIAEGLLEDQISSLETVDGRTIWVRDSSRTVIDNGSEIFEGALVDVTREQLFNVELRRRATQQQALAEIAHVAVRHDDVGDVLSEAAEKLCTVLGAQCVTVAQQQEELGLVTTTVSYQVDSVRDRERLLRYLQSEVDSIPETEEPHRLASEEFAGGENLQGVCLALAGPRETYGVIAVAGRGFNPSEQDLDFLTATAATLGSSIARSRTQAQMAQLIRSKDEFVASVSHELRTPLTVVAGLAFELEQGWRRFSTSELAEFISLIADQSREMGDLIEDLLVAARADIGKVPIHAEAVDLRTCVDQVIASCTLADRARIQANGEEVIALVDPVRVRQIVRNLVTNAIRYGGPHINLAVRSVDKEAIVTVFDDGAGIAEADRDKIFIAYERAHTGSRSVPGSVGLGLTVSQMLTELMGGSIRYSYDGGSLFEVRLPLATTAG